MAGRADARRAPAAGPDRRRCAAVPALSSQGWLQDIFFLWRPFLPDPNDDMILELAFAANCPYIVTHNVRDFAGCERLGIKAITPGDFLKLMREGRKP